MDYSYPDGSPIVIQDGDVVIEDAGSLYFYSNKLYNGSTHTVPLSAVVLSVLETLSPNQINKKIRIYRNGAKMFPQEIMTTPDTELYWVDFDDNQILFHVELVDEKVTIDIDLKA